MIKLDLGCGKNCHTGHIGVDLLRYPGVKVVASIEALPFCSNSITSIWCSHVLEHVDMIPAMREIWRVLTWGGMAQLWLPHATGIGTWADPTHRRGYAWRTWEYFERGDYDLPLFVVVWKKLCWRPNGQFPFLDRLINRMPAFFEKYLAPFSGGCHETGALLKKWAISRVR